MPESIPELLVKEGHEEHEKMAAVPHVASSNSFDVTQKILRLTHSQLMKMLEDSQESQSSQRPSQQQLEEEDQFTNDLEEEKKYHEKQFKVFRMQKTMGSGHGGGGGAGMMSQQNTSIVLNAAGSSLGTANINGYGGNAMVGGGRNVGAGGPGGA